MLRAGYTLFAAFCLYNANEDADIRSYWSIGAHIFGLNLRVMSFTVGRPKLA